MAIATKFIIKPISLLSPSTFSQKSLFPSQSLAISNNSIVKPAKRSGSEPLPMGASSSTAATVIADDIADVLGEINIFTASGDPVKFKDLWDQQEGIAVVALLRHFGCFCSWELAAALKEAKEKFDSAGVKLIAIGVGTPDKAQILAERVPFPLDSLYADPDCKAYNVLGLYYGFRRTFLNPASTNMFSRYQEVKKTMNYTIAATPKDKSGVLQQGGMFVFKGKQLLYARKDEAPGDHASLDDIFNICCKVPSS